MVLTTQQRAARDGKLTASQVSVLMTGDPEKVLNLWRLLVGDPDYVEPDLSEVWAVALGDATEHLNINWFTRKYGKVKGCGDVIVHDNGWAACTLDAWSVDHNCPVETKHCGGFEKLDVLIDRYMPQVHWQMIVSKSKKCALSIIQGAREPIVEFIEYDEAYGKELFERAERFMACVRSLTPPVALPPVKPPVKAIKEYDMRSSNAWVSAAADWLENKLAAKKFDEAEKQIKGCVPDDGKRAFGAGIQARRDKAGRLRILTGEESD